MNNETIEFRGCPTCEGPAQAIATPDGVRYRHVDLRAATLRQAARVDEGSASLAGQGAELASDMAYEANQQNSQELADRAALVHRLATALSAQPAISGSASPQMADARACTPTLAQPASDYAALLERVKVAARALVREHKVYAEDVDTLADVVKALEALAAQPAERQGEAVAKVRHFEYRGIARNGFSQEAEMLYGAPIVPDGTLLYLHPAAPMGVPERWLETIADAAGSLDKRGDRQMAWRLMWLHGQMLAAAPSAPQADRRTNYVSGSVDGSGKFQPTQQDPSAPQGVECKCSLRQRLVGDGCQVCNPKLAAELAADSTHPTERK
jgi:hypothetical protein